MACHDMTAAARSKLGPPLWGIVGRPVASVEGFDYSPAMREAHNKASAWDAATLEVYLRNPRAWAPGTTMVFQGLRRARDRRSLIRYLETLR